MSERYCNCFYQFIIDDPVTVTSTIFSSALSLIIIIIGIFLNYKLWLKLSNEKRSRPLNRKGNVIEPVMSWFCIQQILFWPFTLCYLWINTNEILSAERLPSWLCHVFFNTMKFGRMSIAYNSVFVAMARYIYIVHEQSANQWDYLKTAKRLKIASIVTPFIMEILGALTVEIPYSILQDLDRVKGCLLASNDSEITTDGDEETLQPLLVGLSMQYLPSSLVHVISYCYLLVTGLVLLNFAEGYFYTRIFQTMKR